MLETWVDSWVEKITWRREQLPTPVFWPGEFHGPYSPWGCKELDMTEQLLLHFTSGAVDNILSHVLWAVLQQLKLPPGEDVNCMLPTSTQIPGHLEPEGWWYWLLITSPPTNQKNVHELITLSLNHYHKTSHYPRQVRANSFEGISPLWRPLPSKAENLSFSTSPENCLWDLICCWGTQAKFGFKTKFLCQVYD